MEPCSTVYHIEGATSTCGGAKARGPTCHFQALGRVDCCCLPRSADSRADTVVGRSLALVIRDGRATQLESGSPAVGLTVFPRSRSTAEGGSKVEYCRIGDQALVRLADRQGPDLVSVEGPRRPTGRTHCTRIPRLPERLAHVGVWRHLLGSRHLVAAAQTYVPGGSLPVAGEIGKRRTADVLTRSVLRRFLSVFLSLPQHVQKKGEYRGHQTCDIHPHSSPE